MTENAQKFVTPLTFQTLSQNKVITDMFEPTEHWDVHHISLAKKADVFAVVPATANVIGKIAGGIADDMLTTTIMAAGCRKIIAPAMNTAMWENPIVQENVKKLRGYGIEVLDTDKCAGLRGYRLGKLLPYEEIDRIILADDDRGG
jgi:phosphopantothenoylcysteine decarboxylase/phosphopantothenate--cysteine ligase